MDWAAWSRESVTLISARARELFERHGIAEHAPYRWDIATARFAIGNAREWVYTPRWYR